MSSPMLVCGGASAETLMGIPLAPAPSHHLQGFKTHEFLQRMVIAGERLPVPQDDNVCPLALRRLIGACWADDPDERPSGAEIISELSRMLKYTPRA